MITSLDFLYICLAIGFLIVTVAASVAFYSLAKLLKSLRLSLENINSIGNGIKMGIMSLVKNLILRKAVR